MEKKSTVKHKKLQLTAVLIITDERFEAYEVTTSLPEVIATALSHGSFQHDYYLFLTLCLKKKKKKSQFLILMVEVDLKVNRFTLLTGASPATL